MNHFVTERRAIYSIAKIFTDFGWIFREQPIVDLGIDAIIETPITDNGQIKIFGLQIKGGEANFHKGKRHLTFYFSERHYLYWNAISENYPVFIVLQAPLGDKIYWQHYIASNIRKTSKNWKLDFPYNQILNEDSREEILCILQGYGNFRIPESRLNTNKFVLQNKNQRLTITYNYKPEVRVNMQMCVSFRNDKAFIDLGYMPQKEEWDIERSFLAWDNVYYYSVIDFEKYIQELFNSKSKNNNTFKELINEINIIVKGLIENIAEFIFDHNNKDNKVPKYSDFLKAFELFSKLKREEFEAKALDHIIHFKTKNGTFEINTYESLTEYLKHYIQTASFDEIYTQTNDHIWGEIYIDSGIEKSKFIPVMQNEWECYWDSLYEKIKEETGYTEHLDNRKDESWRKFESFMNLYDNTDNIIELAYDFDDMILYPMAVISMMNIFNPEVCYDEYCELEFYVGNEWESVCLDKDNEDSQVFFLKPCEI